MTMSQYILEAKKLTKIYGIHSQNEFEALHALDFQVEPGESLCIMGPRGSRKTKAYNTSN